MMSDLRKLFQPQVDITTYELARLVPYLAMPSIVRGLGWRFSPQGWDEWPDDLKRHFIDGDPPLWWDHPVARQELADAKEMQMHMEELEKYQNRSNPDD